MCIVGIMELSLFHENNISFSNPILQDIHKYPACKLAKWYIFDRFYWSIFVAEDVDF